MLVGITGLPGNGKTLYALAYVKAWAERENRPVWYHGIKDLALPWHPIPTKVEKVNGVDREVPQWWTAPADSIIVIDEAQNCGFGVRPRTTTPEWSQKLETHRHLGVDLVLITQQPSLLDPHDRALIERHFHVVRKWGSQRATVHEFTGGARDNAGKNRKGSIQHKWKFPKDAFAWYTSAEKHTHKRHIPMRVWVFIALPFVIAALGAIAWFRYLDPSLKAKAAPGPAGASSAPSSQQGPASARLTTAEYVNQQQPRIEGLAYTAPVYDEVTKPVEAPYPAACATMGTRCSCYTQQATRLDMPDQLCRSIVERGFFVAWKLPERQQQAAGPAARQIEPQAAIAAPAGFGSTPRIEPLPATSLLDRDPSQPGGRGRNLPPATQPNNAPS